VPDTTANTPVTPDTVFRAGSISKSFVGIIDFNLHLTTPL